MLIATAIFMFVMLIAVGSLVSMVNADRKAQSVAVITDNLRFAIDDVSRTIRTGTDIDGSVGCSSNTVGTDCYGGTNRVEVTDQDSKRVAYRFSTAAQCNGGGASGQFTSGCLMRSDDAGATFSPITSPELEIEVSGTDASRFYVRGSNPSDTGDRLQPIVSIILQARITKGLSTPTVLHLQTSITQRVYDN
jgi:type II secretory pathway pseudopilin PulG